MIIATKVVHYDELLKRKLDYEAMCEYIHSLVPPEVKNVDAIYHNTRYYFNYMVLRNDSISLADKKTLSNLLTRNIRVVGVMGTYVAFSDLEPYTNTKKLERLRKEFRNGINL